MYPRAKQRKAIDELARLLDERPDDPKELARFQKLMGALVTADDATDDPDDNGELALLEDDPQLVYERFVTVSTEAYDPDAGTAAGLGDLRRKLWEGAKNALRQATYWEMKKRAGVVGQTGLGPLIGRLHEAQPGLRVHLVGHSFGARLVSLRSPDCPPAIPARSSPSCCCRGRSRTSRSPGRSHTLRAGAAGSRGWQRGWTGRSSRATPSTTRRSANSTPRLHLRGAGRGGDGRPILPLGRDGLRRRAGGRGRGGATQARGAEV